MGLVIALHAVLACVVGLGGRRLGRSAMLVAAIGPAAAVAYTAVLTPRVLAGEVVATTVPWVPGLGLALDLRLDGFGLLFWWLIAGIGLLVMLYATRYFAPRNDLGLFTAMLVTFAGSMLLLVAADNVLLLFVAWELTSITSYLLIGFKDTDVAARTGALQALLVTGLGGLAMLGGLVILGEVAGTYALSGILAAPPTSTLAQAGLVLVLLGALTKSAQVPFHFWLPDAMAAPTPVSAYLHSATMVKAGIYLVARFAPAFGPEIGWWAPLLVAVGAASMLVGGWRALQAHDLKALLAFGTVSQLGFLLLLLGVGDPELTHAGVTLLLAHALFKAALFLAAGVVDHQAGTRDLRRLDGIGRSLRVTAGITAVAAASMAGVAPLFGFIAKEAALEAALHQDALSLVLAAAIAGGAVLTTAYGIRLVWGGFAAKSAEVLAEGAVTSDDAPRPALAFDAPALVLVALTVLLGLWVAPADALVGAGAESLAAGAGETHLALWHGFTPALWLSLTAIALGVLLFRAPRLVSRVAASTSRVPEARDGYRRSLFELGATADRMVAVVQPGSLPVYAGIVLLTLLALPGVALIGARSGIDATVGHSWLQTAVAVFVAVSAVGAARLRRRLHAVLVLGSVGFGVAVLFMIQGAPDLALTQLLVETLSLGIFVFVVRHLPERFDHAPWRLGRVLRVVLSVSIGVFVAAFALIAGAARRHPTAAADFLARAEPEGGGRNVVNVILTDFRGLDTFGEITVLVVAAVGIVAIVRARLEPDDAEREEGA